MQVDEAEFIARVVNHINTCITGAYVFPAERIWAYLRPWAILEDVGRFYRLEEYEGYSWTAHGRYPTNTPGWWGGAHPLRCWIGASYITGKYPPTMPIGAISKCTVINAPLQTDTEVITYIADFLLRKRGLTLEEFAHVIAAPSGPPSAASRKGSREQLCFLRKAFPSLLVTGPFSIVLGFGGGLMALNDRLKLRSMVVGEKDDMVYIASEEAAIRVMSPELDRIWAPAGGEPVVVRVKEGRF